MRTTRALAVAVLVCLVGVTSASAAAQQAPAGDATTSPLLAIHDTVVTESATRSTVVKVLVTLSAAQSTDVTVDYKSIPLSATESTGTTAGDYAPAAGPLTVPAQQTTAWIGVKIFGDGVVEGEELFRMSLANPIGATVKGDDALATITIFDAAAVPPVLEGTKPAAPSMSTRPAVLGTATPFVDVAVYASADCTGPVVGHVTPGYDRMFSVPAVVSGLSTFSATTTNKNGTSSCSEPIAYDFDTDGDHVGDTAELGRGTSPTNPDTDSDGLSEGAEIAVGTNPLDPDTNHDGKPDGKSDADGDGLSNAGEIARGTEPTKPDTDGDGVVDGAEVTAGTDPTARSLGTFTPGAPDPVNCTVNSTCADYTVTCPGVPDALGGVLATSEPAGTPRGVVILQGGSGETHYFGEGADGIALVRALTSQGLVVVQPMWDDNWSAVSAPVGPAAVACREATVVRHVYDAVYSALPPTARLGRSCGFCLGGQSSGSSVFAYALNRYGLAPIVDRVVFASGPPHVGLDVGCLDTNPLVHLHDPFLIDRAYGYSNNDGPCLHKDAQWAAAFKRDSVESSGRNRFATTEADFVVSDDPNDSVVYHAMRWAAQLWTNNTKLSVTVIPDMPHNVRDSAPGRAAFVGYLTG